MAMFKDATYILTVRDAHPGVATRRLYDAHSVPGVQRRDFVSFCQGWIVEGIFDKIVQRSVQVEHGLTDMNQFGGALADDVNA